MTKMLIDRAVVEQALEALKRATPADSAQAVEQLNAITALKAALAEDALQRLTDVSQEIEAAITESILDIDRKEPQPGMVNLDAFHAFHFNDPPKGGFVGEIEMLKWLVRNRDGDYWKAKQEEA